MGVHYVDLSRLATGFEATRREVLVHEPHGPVACTPHACVWKHNPAGTFADVDPRRSCP